MTTYYLSSAGSDANNGLGPDASHASNKPFLTLGKCIGASGVCVPGDTVYVGPGVIYEGATIACASGVSSSASPTAIRGDPTNAQGFKTAAAVLLGPGVCWITMLTSGEGIDAVQAATGSFLTPVTGCHGVQFYDVAIYNQTITTGGAVTLNPDGNKDWLFQDCRLIGYAILRCPAAVAATATRNWTFRRCDMITHGLAVIWASTVAAATADANLTIVFENCLIIGQPTSGSFATSASGGNLAGGMSWTGCTVVSCGGTGLTWGSFTGKVSTVTPCRLAGNLVLGGAVVAANAGHYIDDGYNRFLLGAAHLNYTPAGTSTNGYLPNLVLPDLVKWGLEMPRADFLGWTDAAATTQKYSAWAPSSLTDFRGRTIRPWGSGSSIGAHELGLLQQDTSSAITAGGANSLLITGAGELSVHVPVNAVSTTLTVVTKSTSYGGASYPQLIVQPNPLIGVTVQTDTAVAAAEETLSVTFTPTAAGVVEVRLISRSTSVSSSTFFDSLAG